MCLVLSITEPSFFNDFYIAEIAYVQSNLLLQVVPFAASFARFGNTTANSELPNNVDKTLEKRDFFVL